MKSFLDLPPEIRNTIYEFAVTCDNDEDCRITACAPWPNAADRPIQELCMEPALTRTCRQIRHESLPMFYSMNTFCSDSNHFTLKWLQHLRPEKYVALTSLRVGDEHFAPLSLTYAEGQFAWFTLEMGSDDLLQRGVLRVPMRVEGEGVLWVTLADLLSFERGFVEWVSDTGRRFTTLGVFRKRRSNT
ncbi:hypothetical protein CLAFUW4_12549 [Fulvia fulva]|uniref:2EXR domain-containing protein n=1 Tax=Passalora fulva TaxID=5499 RepID=A0A9Q8PDM2_PASFU|nr:uncharacterized protein CLAFUR5_11574 [Fulvia fulva]KAK4618342.1 hypothetical protein CLAFUR4_12554 [Fulvia fulva]KAK4618829.1 hypothetical protein CLAFUR0_12565 [Fulvia fulva]UJO20506.1 hypothetical protein CLAFUR5_11574 [Fulvia fulva]WPV18036.1 hypothetical protein CLAFUW4_12549 [Fulvia fulva]WPV32824.1 hypothetical protein CLAFUW7_12556 [Fulvia fulva]